MRERGAADALRALVRVAVPLAVAALALGAVQTARAQAMSPPTPGRGAVEESGGGVLQGRVVDPDGQPVAAAEVVVVDEPSSGEPEAEANRSIVGVDEKGSFRMSLRPGSYLVEVVAPGWLGVRKRVEVPVGTVSPRFVLTRSATLFGQVLDLPPSSVHGLGVRAVPEGEAGGRGVRNGRLEPDGGYEIGGLSEGPYRLELIVAGRAYVATPAGQDSPGLFVPGGSRTRADLALPPLGALAGEVRPAVRGPLTVEVSYDDAQRDVRQVPVSAGGAYSIKGLRTGQVAVSVRARDAAPAREARLELVPGEATPFDIVLGEGAVSGTVVDPRTGGPLERAWLRLETLDEAWQEEGTGGPLGDAVTDAKGRYRFGGLPAGPYQLAVGAHGFAPQSVRFNSDGSSDLQVHVRLVPGIDVVVVVQDAAGRPEPNARVRLEAEDDAGLGEIGGGLTDERGTALVPNVPAGQFLLTVFHGMAAAPEEGTALAVSQQRVAVAEATNRFTVRRKGP